MKQVDQLTKALAEQEKVRKGLQASVDSSKNQELLAMQVFQGNEGAISVRESCSHPADRDLH